MPFDGILTKAITKELSENLIGGKIRKVYQPEAYEIKLLINSSKGNFNLLISANSGNSRIHLTEINKKNPEVPPTFCMTLRKQIVGSEIIGIKQYKSDRVIIIELKSYSEFKEPIVKNLICEITGHNSNIILTRVKDGEEIIIDSLKKVGSLKSKYRHILPGIPYVTPPIENKHSLFDFDKEEFEDNFNNSVQIIEKFFPNYFLGISPSLIREVCYLTGVESNLRIDNLNEKEKKEFIKNFYYLLNSDLIPKLYFSENKEMLDFHVLNLTYLTNHFETIQSVSELLETYYHLRDKRANFRSKSQNLKHEIQTLRNKNSKKLKNLHRDLKKSKDNKNNKLYGDLITANIWNLSKGITEAELLDYTVDPPRLIKVPLKINETPAQNAQRFYKKYSKNKRAQIELTKQIEKTLDELDYIDSLLNSLETSIELEDLNEIQQEFNNSGLKKKKVQETKQTNKAKQSKPLHFISSEGFDIYVGKNNYQNDFITTTLGRDEDCWLHVKDAPGSHVLIVANGKFITEQTVLEGGMLAAYYSKLKQSENIPVDYMEFKFVKKPKNAKPGKVIFTEHNTMYVTPDLERLNNLEKI